MTWATALELLDTAPGINQRAGEAILAEIGVDMSQFPTANHLAAWSGLAPGNNESGGKRFSGRTRKGKPDLTRLDGTGVSCRQAQKGELCLRFIQATRR